MGLDVTAFNRLASHFRLFSGLSKRNCRTRGRPRLLNSEDVLALVLHYLCSRAEQNIIGRLFGIPAASTSYYLWTGMQALCNCLQKMKESRIEFPNVDKMQELSALITEVEPSVNHVFGFVDGLNCPIRDPQDPNEQNAYYNGWLAGCYVSSVILYGSDGTILWIKFNAPGSWHDARIAEGLFEKLINHCPEPFAILSDSAFPRNEQMKFKILSPLKESEVTLLSSEEKEVRAQSRIITSIRQAAEWGMRTVQGVNARLTTNLPSDKEKRALLLETCFRLHNYRARMNQPNQIRTVYCFSSTCSFESCSYYQ